MACQFGNWKLKSRSSQKAIETRLDCPQMARSILEFVAK